jgi:hypothetical protein
MAGSSPEDGQTTDNRHRAAESREPKRGTERGTQEAREAAKGRVETAERQAAETVRAAGDTVKLTHDVARMGLQAAAEVQGQIADIGNDQGRQGIKAAARVTDIYRETTESTARDVQALMTAFSSFGHGVQQMQHAWFDLLNKSIDQATRRPRDLLRFGSPVELAETQRDLYRDGVAYMVDATTTMLHLMGQTAQDASRALESRARSGGRG